MSDSTHAANLGVSLPSGVTGSRFFYDALRAAADAFPDALSRAGLPNDPKQFRKAYADAVVRFEAARVASDERVEIARFLTRAVHRGLWYRDAGGERPLAEVLAEGADEPALIETQLGSGDGLEPIVPFRGETHRGRGVIALVERMRALHQMTDAAVAAARWIVDRAAADGGKLRLDGERFVVLGAAAELAPTRLLLEAGATVLWVDLTDPAAFLQSARGLSGTLVHAASASNLLTEPAQVAAAIRAFTDDGPAHLGLFAYAPGKGRELRLAAAMDAIARSLDPARVASVALYVSPTTPATAQPEDVWHAQARLSLGKRWQKALRLMRALGTPGHVELGDAIIARAIMPLQGPSYQAAQYLTKMATAETWATAGGALDADTPRPVTTSANVAGITNTRSLNHPLFQVAFAGAPTFDVEIFETDTTRSLNGLMMLHDVLNPEAPGAAGGLVSTPRDKARALMSQQVHGGVFGLPWLVEDTVRAAAVIGAAKRPGLLFRR